MLGDDGRGELQHGFEIHQVALPAQILVPGVEPGDHLGGQRRGAGRFRRGCGVVVRPDLGHLGPLDLRRHVPQFGGPGAYPQPARRLGQQAHLGVQHRRRAPAHGRGPEVGELAQRGRVEGARLDPLETPSRPGQLHQPGAHLPGRAGGERHREHVSRVHDPGQRRVGDPVRDRAGLAGSRPGEHAHGPRDGQGDLTLLRVQRGQHGLRIAFRRRAGIWPGWLTRDCAHVLPPARHPPASRRHRCWRAPVPLLLCVADRPIRPDNEHLSRKREAGTRPAC